MTQLLLRCAKLTLASNLFGKRITYISYEVTDT